MKGSKRLFRRTLFLCFLYVPCSGSGVKPEPSESPFHRIISFAPSITETLFALSLGDRVVGVSSFCKYPIETKTLPSVGGFTDPNFEMILQLKPDCVFLLKEQGMLFDFLKRNGIENVCIDNHNVTAILESFRIIGKKCGRVRQADSLVRLINGEFAIKDGREGKIPKVLLCIDRDNPGYGRVSREYAAGPSTFYSDLLNNAGMENAVTAIMDYPQLSLEGILRLQPDIVIDLSMRRAGQLPERIADDWQSLPAIPAVKNGMVFCFSAEYMTIPGPRVFLILKDLKRILSIYRNSPRK